MRWAAVGRGCRGCGGGERAGITGVPVARRPGLDRPSLRLAEFLHPLGRRVPLLAQRPEKAVGAAEQVVVVQMPVQIMRVGEQPVALRADEDRCRRTTHGWCPFLGDPVGGGATTTRTSYRPQHVTLLATPAAVAARLAQSHDEPDEQRGETGDEHECGQGVHPSSLWPLAAHSLRSGPCRPSACPGWRPAVPRPAGQGRRSRTSARSARAELSQGRDGSVTSG